MIEQTLIINVNKTFTPSFKFLFIESLQGCETHTQYNFIRITFSLMSYLHQLSHFVINVS